MTASQPLKGNELIDCAKANSKELLPPPSNVAMAIEVIILGNHSSKLVRKLASNSSDTPRE